MNITWKAQTGAWSNGEGAYLGHWKVGAVFYNPTKTRGDKNLYRASCELPGIKDVIGDYTTLEEGKAELTKAILYWLKKAVAPGG